MARTAGDAICQIINYKNKINVMVAETPLVSVICITFNQCSFIRDCLDGIVGQQTTFPFEIIVYDDASTDGTSDILRSYAEKYPYIHLLIQEYNQYSKGKGFVGMNMCIESSQGAFLAICEGDDMWTNPLKLQKEVEYLYEHKTKRFVFTDFTIIDGKNREIQSNVFLHNPDYLGYSFKQQLLSPGFYAPMTWCFYREDYNKLFTIEGSCDLSYAIWIHFLSHDSVGYISDNTANYRFLQGSLSHPNSSKMMYERCKRLFGEQLTYMDHYQVDDYDKQWLRQSSYLKLLPRAIEHQDESFIQEAKSYFEKSGIIYDAMIASFDDLYYKQVDELKAIKKSKAYKWGKKMAKLYNGIKHLTKDL